MPSIFSERTAEYAIVPTLQRQLLSYYAWAIPFYVWASREGSAAAKEANGELYGRVLAVFARRVKTTSKPHVMEGKINVELIEYHYLARQIGIHSIAAYAAVRSLHHLHQEPAMLWLSLTQPTGAAVLEDVRFRAEPVPPEGEVSLQSTSPIDILHISDIVRGIEQHGRLFSYVAAMEAIAEIRASQQSRRTHFLDFLGGYKPVYFFLPPITMFAD